MKDRMENMYTDVNPLYPNISMHILYTVLYTFLGANEENLFNNQELLHQLVIIFYILVTSMCDSVVIQQGEIRCLSLLGCKGFYFL